MTIPGSNWGNHADYTAPSAAAGRARTGPSNLLPVLLAGGLFLLCLLFGFVAMRASAPKGAPEISLVEKVALESAGEAVRSQSDPRPEPATTTTRPSSTTTTVPVTTTVPPTLPPANNTAPTVNIPIPTNAPPQAQPPQAQPPQAQPPQAQPPQAQPPQAQPPQQPGGGGGGGGGPVTTPRRTLVPR